jgi:SAM-dependent methyltransferase
MSRSEANPGPGELRNDAPRLEDLRRRYRATTTDARSASGQWSPEYVASDLDLGDFRADNVYVYQGRDGNTEATYLLTAYYLMATGRGELLDTLSEDGAFGAETVSLNGKLISRDLLDSVSEIAFLDDELGVSEWPQLRILDIGAGYGRFAHRLVEAFPDRSLVWCVDAVPESTFLSEYYLRHRRVDDRARVIELPDLDAQLTDLEIDVAVNIHSFAEVPLSVIGAWLDTVAGARIPHLMIVPNRFALGGMALVSREADGSGLDYRPELERRGYRLRTMRPKYRHRSVQTHGVSPTHYWLFSRE